MISAMVFHEVVGVEHLIFFIFFQDFLFGLLKIIKLPSSFSNDHRACRNNFSSASWKKEKHF